MTPGPEDLLLEIGCEELPARFLPPAEEQLGQGAAALLARDRVAHGPIRTFSTPRRLALAVAAVAPAQADLRTERKGPSARAAFDREGRPTPAAVGFARSAGVPVEALVIRETEQGAYVFAPVFEAGRPTAELLPGILRELVLQLAFPKSMRWGEGELRFGRPIRWLVALYGRQVVPLGLDGLAAADKTLGHRFLAPGPHRIPHPGRYLAVLKEAAVLADPEERRARILRQVRELAREVGGRVLEDPELVEEVVNLVEFPTGLRGAFAREFLALPHELLTTVMKEHQRFFPVVGEDGRLLPWFCAVANTAPDHLETVRRGYERVLAARLADAAFYFAEDQKKPLAAFADRLAGIVFHEALGTLADKSRRLVHLAGTLGEAAGLSPEMRTLARRAAELAKADLATGVVFEFPELQGIMGREYARLSGEPPEVAAAIAEHWQPRHAGDSLPLSEVGRLLAVADRLDTLVGSFGVGLVPTGSQDPYGLRRQAIGLLRLLLAGPFRFTYPFLFAAALAAYREVGPRTFEDEEAELVTTLAGFLDERLRSLLAEEGLRADVVNAALAAAPGDPVGTRRRAHALAAFLAGGAAADLHTGYTRVANLAGDDPAGEVHPELFRHEAERDLWAAARAVEGMVREQVAQESYGRALEFLADLAGPIARFFEGVLVMAPEPAVRANRLNLLRHLRDLFRNVVDLSKVSAG